MCASPVTSAGAQTVVFEAMPNDLVWPPTEEVSFEELCRGAARYFDEGFSHRATCTVTDREGEYLVVQLQMGIWQSLYVCTRRGGRYRFIGTLATGSGSGNHPSGVEVLELRLRRYQGQPLLLLTMRHRWAHYYGNGYQECEDEYLQICHESEAANNCETHVRTRRQCVSGPLRQVRFDSSWWQLRHQVTPSNVRAEVQIGDEGLLHVTLREGTWSALLGQRDAEAVEDTDTRVTLRFAPAPPMPEPPPFIEAVCRARHEDDWQDRCDDRPQMDRYPLSLQRHSDFQALCDDARGSRLDITGCSEERMTRNFSMVRTRRDEDAGPTFFAERRGSTIRLISRMSEASPQRSTLRFVRQVHGPGRYYGIEFEERTLATTRRHLLVCQRGRQPRCSLRVPLRCIRQGSAGEGHGFGGLEVEHFSQADAEIRRDGTLVLTRVSGDWADLFGVDRSPHESEERVVYRF